MNITSEYLAVCMAHVQVQVNTQVVNTQIRAPGQQANAREKPETGMGIKDMEE